MTCIKGVVSPTGVEVRITSGNSCPTNDGISAAIIMSEEMALRLGLDPLARIVGFGIAGVKPQVMGLGPIPSTRKAFRNAVITADQIDCVEFNEAFAAQVIPSASELGIPLSRINVNGGSIALGHPLGATGARLVLAVAHELRRSGGRYGLATQCIGMGMGMGMGMGISTHVSVRHSNRRGGRETGPLRICSTAGGTMPRSIGIVLFEGAEELDFAGPWEVFTMLAQLAPGSCIVFTVSELGGEVKCAKGLRVIVDHSFADCPAADIIVVPGGQGTRREADNPAMIAFVQRMDGGTEVTASVCTGAFVLEKAGLLAGKRATTHWGSIERLRARGTVEVLEGVRFVDEGRVVTASGVSAGIDMSLHLAGRLWSPEVARTVQKAMEYYPEPPYQDG